MMGAERKLTAVQVRGLKAVRAKCAWKWVDGTPGYGCDSSSRSDVIARLVEKGLADLDPVGARHFTHTLVLTPAGQAALKDAERDG